MFQIHDIKLNSNVDNNICLSSTVVGVFCEETVHEQKSVCTWPVRNHSGSLLVFLHGTWMDFFFLFLSLMCMRVCLPRFFLLVIIKYI